MTRSRPTPTANDASAPSGLRVQGAASILGAALLTALAAALLPIAPRSLAADGDPSASPANASASANANVAAEAPPASSRVARRTAAVEAIRRVQPSVVSISSEKKAGSPSRWPFTPEENARPRVSGMGTGIIVDARGYILTNHHVVDKVNDIEVQLHNGAVFPARLLQQNRAGDLALVKIEPNVPLVPITFGSSADLMVGEEVITIGNAFGYENTVSIGIVSALGRNVTLSDDQVYRNLIQTDACINPGNSGGPLVNIHGELVGVNVAVRAGAQGIGFALPIDDVKRVVVEMMSTARLASTWHGIVAAETLTDTDRKVVIAAVQPGSPAEAAGFLPGDQLLRAGEFGVLTAIDVERGLLDARPGVPVPFEVVRGDRRIPLPLAVEPLPRGGLNASLLGALPGSNRPNDPAAQVYQLLGIRAVPVKPEYVTAVSPKLRGGLYVQDVAPDSPAARADIAKGDILVGLNVANRHWETIRPDNVLYVVDQLRDNPGAPLGFYLVRRNAMRQGHLNFSVGRAEAAQAPAPAVRR